MRTVSLAIVLSLVGLAIFGCGDGGSDSTGAAGTSPDSGKGGNVSGKEKANTAGPPTGEAPPPAPMSGG